MTDELNRLSSDREETDRRDSVPTGADGVTAVVEHTMENDLPSIVTFELIPDWLKPMEEEDDAVEGDKTMERSSKKTIPNILKKKRGRGRPPLPKTVRARLNMIKAQGSAVQKMSVDTINDSKRSTARIAKRRMSTPIRPQHTPTLPTGSITIFSSPVFCSPPRLTRVSPLNVDGTQIPCHSPSLQLSSDSQQISPATAGNNGTEMPLHIWQGPPLQPISPPKTPEAFVDQTVTIGSPDSPDDDLNESEPEKEEILLLMRDCVGCGGPFPAEKVGDTLCHKCKPVEKKHSPPNIVFRKKATPKYKKVIKKDLVPDVGGDDEDEDDECNWMSRKRSKNRRMCRSCDACLRGTDCGVCDFCMDKPKFGGSNKKRQKCRLRQCQFQSRLHHQVPRVLRSPRRRNIIKKKLKPGQPKRRRTTKNPWDVDGEDYGSDNEYETKLKHFKTKGTRKRQRKKWNYSFKEEEEEEMFIEAVVDEDEPDESDSLSLVRNEPMKLVMDNNGAFNVTQPPQSREIYYTLPGVPEASRMLSPVTLCNSNPEAPIEAGGVAGPLPVGITQNDILQIEMVRVGSPVSEFIEPQNTAQPEQQEITPEHTPVITQIFSLAIGTECDFERDPGLMDLFHSLRQTVLPAHWVGVMAKGPILQLLQCSKLSTMADTVIQIEKGFFYQVSVQNQPLLLMHSVYMHHPTCLTSVGDVVSLLLDLEGMSVCQGHQNFNLGTPWEPRMCVRAALCDLLIPKDEEQCEKCAHPEEV
ncbi:methyl-CpG-binding domain protein 1a isoform X2 [Triplophysa dalaica]|uniref:methyl-CpG-binding domain protein 1a isoform X2 n=1 Tax=Triplophysa dalaica TaxID=1582913 RepID=UPI0024E00220|nr:methyl-CpG-binding domain protein 1a isoform X2 [Triplophysa dalaica]